MDERIKKLAKVKASIPVECRREKRYILIMWGKIPSLWQDN